MISPTLIDSHGPKLTGRRYTKTGSIEHQGRAVVDDQVEETCTHGGSRGGLGSKQYSGALGEIDVSKRSDRDAISSYP